MLGATGYKTKKDLKESIGKKLTYVETSSFGTEFKSDGLVTIVGPNAYNSRKWFATVTLENGIITRVI